MPEKWSALLAQELNGGHIDAVVRLPWSFPNSDVEAVVVGQVREIHHTPGGVWVWLTGIDNHTGDKSEFWISHEVTMEVR